MLTTIVWLVTAILLLYPEVSIEVRSAAERSDVIVIEGSIDIETKTLSVIVPAVTCGDVTVSF